MCIRDRPEQGAANEIHGAGAAPPVQTIPVHVSFPYTPLLIYRHGQAAVSYTHLDGYKRQGLCRFVGAAI